jgi:hypothetical protein
LRRRALTDFRRYMGYSGIADRNQHAQDVRRELIIEHRLYILSDESSGF